MNWSEDYWFHPTYAIEYFWELNKRTNGKAIKSPNYKKEREAWIMGVALLAINKHTTKNWWLQIPKDDPPDMSCMTMVNNHGYNELNQQDVEILTINKYSKQSISQTIKSKLELKAYPDRYVLLIYLSRYELINFEKISQEVNKFLNKKVSSIWFIGNNGKNDPKKYIVFQLYPKIYQYQINLNEELINAPETRFMVVTKNFKKNVPFVKIKHSSIPEFVPKI